MNNNWKKITSIFDVVIPTIDGKSVAYTVPVEVVCEIEPHSGEKILTPDSLALIEKTKGRHMERQATNDCDHAQPQTKLDGNPSTNEGQTL